MIPDKEKYRKIDEVYSEQIHRDYKQLVNILNSGIDDTRWYILCEETNRHDRQMVLENLSKLLSSTERLTHRHLWNIVSCLAQEDTLYCYPISI